MGMTRGLRVDARKQLGYPSGGRIAGETARKMFLEPAPQLPYTEDIFGSIPDQYFDPETKESYVPYVLETSIGCDRMFLALMGHALQEEVIGSDENNKRDILKLHPALAPIKFAGTKAKMDPVIDELLAGRKVLANESTVSSNAPL